MAIGHRFDEVLTAARAGGDWAWKQIYDDLAPAVRGYLRAQGSREPDDVLGEVFVRVVRDIGRFEGDETGFRSWVFVIAHRRLQDERRSRSRHPVDPVTADRLDGVASDQPESEAVASATTAHVTMHLRRLAPDQRDVLTLRIIGGLTVEEVAQALGKRPGAVKALQRRGLNSLRRLLEREGAIDSLR